MMNESDSSMTAAQDGFARMFAEARDKIVHDICSDMALIEPESEETKRIRLLVDKEMRRIIGGFVWSIQYGSMSIPTYVVNRLGIDAACCLIESLTKQIAEKITGIKDSIPQDGEI